MNKEEIEETPVYEDFVVSNLNYIDAIYKQQIFLQDQGVSFEYSDSLVFFERNRLVELYNAWIEEKSNKSKQI